MQIHCQQCHKPFALNKETIYQVLDMMVEQELHHYNAQCPHCRRINRVPYQDLVHAAPGWEKKEPTKAD